MTNTWLLSEFRPETGGARLLWLARQILISAESGVGRSIGSVRGIGDHLGVHNQTLWGGADEIKRITGN
jgi:hypothetical protein